MPDAGGAFSLWAPRAWLDGRWQQAVLLEVDAGGRWASITPNVGTPPAHATRLPGPLLPGLVDAHSHAFQRAFAGLAERLAAGSGSNDDFWSWRDRMYGAARAYPTTSVMTAQIAESSSDWLKTMLASP